MSDIAFNQYYFVLKKNIMKALKKSCSQTAKKGGGGKGCPISKTYSVLKNLVNGENIQNNNKYLSALLEFLLFSNTKFFCSQLFPVI